MLFISVTSTINWILIRHLISQICFLFSQGLQFPIVVYQVSLLDRENVSEEVNSDRHDFLNTKELEFKRNNSTNFEHAGQPFKSVESPSLGRDNNIGTTSSNG